MALDSSFFYNPNRIHYMDSKPLSDASMVPLIICPGLSETAEEYEDMLMELLPRRGIVLSFRGRGQSETPLTGYDLHDHVEDLEGLVEHLSLRTFHLLANSRGVSYALAYVERNSSKVKSILLEDYPPEHKAMPDGWADEYIHNYLIPYRRVTNITRTAVRGIQEQSTQLYLTHKLYMPTLILRGMLEDSLISEEHMSRYREMSEECKEVQFHESGHNIRSTEREKLHQTIREFLIKAD
ncbi:alpha/beta fold hydrolase [Paenibacillus sp. GCM10023252]|uniref:alpha/beta fold hydrolase n=1 Tax=Paenibacillus sp. GCM10023252 TaxID=3252649 RepID=UPI003606F273